MRTHPASRRQAEERLAGTQEAPAHPPSAGLQCHACTSGRRAVRGSFLPAGANGGVVFSLECCKNGLFGRNNVNPRALVPRLGARPDLFIQQALKPRCLINTPTALGAEEARRKPTLARRHGGAHGGAGTQPLPLRVCPCHIDEMIPIYTAKNQTFSARGYVQGTHPLTDCSRRKASPPGNLFKQTLVSI